MKNLLIGLSLLGLTSCGIGDSVGKSVGKSIGEGVSKSIQSAGESLTSKTDSEVEGIYVNTTKSQLGPLSCIFKVTLGSIPQVLFDALIEGIAGKRYSLEIPRSLSQRIVKDLREKAKDQKLIPEQFWNRLDSQLAVELNNLLINKNINLNLEQFELLQKKAAMSLSLLVESGDYDSSLKLKFDTKDGEQIFTVAFTDDAKNKIDLSSCSDYDISAITAPDDLHNPEDITTLVECSGEDNQSISLRGVQNTDLAISYTNEDVSRTLDVDQDDLELVKSRSKYKTLALSSAEIDSLKLKLEYSKNFSDDEKKYNENDYYRATLYLKQRGERRVKLKKLSCKTLKPLL